MALNYRTRYAGQTVTDAAYPQGKARDIVVEGDGLGTPWQKDLTNDYWGLLQSLLERSGPLPVTPSGTPDTGLVSQYFDAINTMISRKIARSNVGTWNTGSPIVYFGQAPAGIAGGLHPTRGSEWWMMVGTAQGGTDPVFLNSSDGMVWDKGPTTLKSGVDIFDITYDVNNGLWIFCGEADGADAYMGSIDDPEFAFVERTNPKNFSLRHILSNDTGTTIAVGSHDGTDVYAVRSTDGIAFAEVSLAATGGNGAAGIAHGNGKWVVVGDNAVGNAPAIWESADDGLTWTPRTVPAEIGNFLRHVSFDGTTFLAVDTSDGTVIASLDGVTWATVRDPTTFPDDTGVVGIASDPTTGISIMLQANNWALLISDDHGVTWTRVHHIPSVPNPFSGAEQEWDIIAAHKGAWLLGGNADSNEIVAAKSANIL